MIREIRFNDKSIEYTLQRKKVKNINIRIKPDMTVSVSANPRVSLKEVDMAVLNRAEFIIKALENFKNNSKSELRPLFTRDEISDIISDFYNKIYNSFKEYYNIPYPTLKIKTMRSRWGSCNYKSHIITLSTNLVYCSREQIYYVIVHEFSHLIVPNHSQDFYAIVERFVPDYKRIRCDMNRIILK